MVGSSRAKACADDGSCAEPVQHFMRRADLTLMTFSKRRGPAGAPSSAALAAVFVAGAVQGAKADRIKNPIAVFAGLDKITGRIIAFEVATGETVQFGSLQITSRVCYTRPRTEAPQTTTFVEVDEIDAKNEYKRIFSGWMYAASPGLHGVEHPVYDIWLTDCKGGTTVIADPKPAPEAEPPPAEAGRAPKPGTVPRPRRTIDPNAAPPADGGQPLPPPGAPIEVRPPPGALPSGQQLPPVPGQQAPSRQQPPSNLPGGLRPPRDVAPAPAPAEPRRQPSQRFFPTDPAPMRDPAGN